MSSKQSATVTFEQAVLKAKVAQICDHVGYHAITQDSFNILVDIYQRMIYHLGRHCKDAANNNRRVEPTIIDLIQACDFVGVSIPSLQEHIETVKLPLDIDIQQDEPKPSNRIQRNLLVDDLLESEKNSHPEDAEDGENKAISESGIEEDEKSNVPLLKDSYEELVNKFPACNPVTADKKIRLGGRILFLGANTKLKISAPIPPEPVPSTSGIDSKVGTKRKRKEVEKKQKSSEATKSRVSPVKLAKGKRKKKISREFVIAEPSPEKELESDPVSKNEVPQIEDSEDIEDEEARLEKERKQRDKEEEREKEREREQEREQDKELREQLEKEKEKVEKDKVKIRGRGRGRGKEKEKGKTRGKLNTKSKSKEKEKVKEKEKDKGKGRGNKKNVTKKPKVIVTPLDPAIAEPPSFFPILEAKVEEPEIVEPPPPPPVVQPDPPSNPEPVVAPIKQTKTKKKKKSNNQFAIVTESVTKTEEKEYFCPACGGPDDGDVMVECDSCQEWYHLRCISLKKAPEDHENWECDLCINKRKAAQKRPQTPVEAIKVKLEVPEPVVSTPPPPPPPVAAAGTSHDDLCPECNLPDDGTLMIQCDDPFCAKWFHGKCVSLLEEPKEDESWFCKVCVDKQQSAFKRRRRAK